MKKYIFFLLTVATLLGCRKNEEKERESYLCCGAPFMYFYLKVDKSLVKEDLSAKFSINQVTSEGNKKKKLTRLNNKERDDAEIFFFSVIMDVKRSLTERSETYLLEIPDKEPIRITVIGQFVEEPDCCDTPRINKVLLNDELWNPQKEDELYNNVYVLPLKD